MIRILLILLGIIAVVLLFAAVCLGINGIRESAYCFLGSIFTTILFCLGCATFSDEL